MDCLQWAAQKRQVFARPHAREGARMAAGCVLMCEESGSGRAVRFRFRVWAVVVQVIAGCSEKGDGNHSPVTVP